MCQILTVGELIKELEKMPKNNIIMGQIGDDDEYNIIDVLIGGGTMKGFSFISFSKDE